MPNEMTPLEAAEILEHPEKHLQGRLAVQPSLLQGTPDCVGGKIGFSKAYCNAIKYATSLLRQIAAGELIPVIHAHWIPYGESESGKVLTQCSHCHVVGIGTPKFCGGCGALMDGSDMRQTQGGKDDNS